MTMKEVYDSYNKLNDALRDLAERYQRGEVQRVELPKSISADELILSREVEEFLEAREKYRRATACVSVREY